MWPAFLRRTFLGQLLLAPLVPKLLLQQASSKPGPGISPELWARVPEELRYVRVPLPEGADAWPLWKQAFAALKPEPELLSEGAAYDVEAPDVIGAEREAADRWLDENQEALRLMKLGLSRGRLQVPLLAPGESFSEELMEPMQQLRNFSRLLALQAKNCAREGDLDGALRTWLDLHQAARLMADGEGYLVHWLVANAVSGVAYSGMQRLARHPNITVEQLQSLQTELAGRSVIDSAVMVTRVELCAYSLPQITLLPDGGLLHELIATARKSCGPEPSSNAEKLAERDAQRHRLQLLEGHPLPFDKGETVALLSAVHKTCLVDFDRPATAPNLEILPAEVRAALKAWPAPLTFGSMDNAAAVALTPDQIETARQRVRTIRNPVGKLLVGELTMVRLREVRCTREADRRSTQLVVALRLYNKLHHQTPAQLQDLVDRGILKQLPLDPHAEKSFGYLPDRRLIWSVGNTGEYQPQDEATMIHGFRRFQWPFAELRIGNPPGLQ